MQAFPSQVKLKTNNMAKSYNFNKQSDISGLLLIWQKTRPKS